MSQRNYIPNPTGKNGHDPLCVELRAFARQYSQEAIQVILDVMRTSTDAKIKMDAANHILDRAHGKPLAASDVARMVQLQEHQQPVCYVVRGFRRKKKKPLPENVTVVDGPSLQRAMAEKEGVESSTNGIISGNI